jgi:hypothetical protein
VAGGCSGEVLWLGGYTGVRPEPKMEEKRGCGAHRGGKRGRCFGVNSARAAALRCSRPVHRLYGEGEKGVDEPRCRAWLWNEGERRRASVALHRERKGKGEGSSVGGAYGRRRMAWVRGSLAADGVRMVAPMACRQRRVRVGVTARGSKGTGWCVWAAREHVGQPGDRRSWAGPERTVPTWI